MKVWQHCNSKRIGGILALQQNGNKKAAQKRAAKREITISARL
jgi:hypothetical protein